MSNLPSTREEVLKRFEQKDTKIPLTIVESQSVMIVHNSFKELVKDVFDNLKSSDSKEDILDELLKLKDYCVAEVCVEARARQTPSNPPKAPEPTATTTKPAKEPKNGNTENSKKGKNRSKKQK